MVIPQESLAVETRPRSALGLDIDQVRELGERELVLIVDDDEDVVDMLKLILRNAGLNVTGALTGEDAVRKCADMAPDAVLLDLLMPDMSGWETFEQIQNISSAPVLIVSAVVVDDSVERALDMGADDYVKKPFSAKEVVARVRAALRRSGQVETPNVHVFPQIGLTINLETRQVWLEDQPVKLSSIEFAVLKVLAEHAPRPAPYERITESVWGEDSPKARKRAKWAIYTLRRKLEEDPSNPELIINHMQFGYQLQA